MNLKKIIEGLGKKLKGVEDSLFPDEVDGEDFCPYLERCNSPDDVIMNLCALNYVSCDKYAEYKEVKNEQK